MRTKTSISYSADKEPMPRTTLRIQELELALRYEKELSAFLKGQNLQLIEALGSKRSQVEPESDTYNPFEGLKPDPEFSKQVERSQREAQDFHGTWQQFYDGDQVSLTKATEEGDTNAS